VDRTSNNYLRNDNSELGRKFLDQVIIDKNGQLGKSSALSLKNISNAWIWMMVGLLEFE
jgi:hypothetical protein